MEHRDPYVCVSKPWLLTNEELECLVAQQHRELKALYGTDERSYTIHLAITLNTLIAHKKMNLACQFPSN
jgi:hypothetical protein